jgi:predicted transcriptional regulator
MASVADTAADSTFRRSSTFIAYEVFNQAQMGWELLSPKIPTGIPPQQIEALGEALSEELGYRVATDIRELIGKMGGTLMVVPLRGDSDATVGQLLVRPGTTEFKIVVSAASSSRQDQLSVAKALGHYFLHYRFFQIQKEKTSLKSSRALVDHEALIFALAFLMPKSEFKRVRDVTNGQMDLIAASFGVPLEAANLREHLLKDQ